MSVPPEAACVLALQSSCPLLLKGLCDDRLGAIPPLSLSVCLSCILVLAAHSLPLEITLPAAHREVHCPSRHPGTAAEPSTFFSSAIVHLAPPPAMAPVATSSAASSSALSPSHPSAPTQRPPPGPFRTTTSGTIKMDDDDHEEGHDGDGDGEAEDDEDDEFAYSAGETHEMVTEQTVKAGYLWKKGEKRKVSGVVGVCVVVVVAVSQSGRAVVLTQQSSFSPCLSFPPSLSLPLSLSFFPSFPPSSSLPLSLSPLSPSS